MADHLDLYKKFGLPDPVPFGTDLTIHIGEAHNEVRLIVKHHLQKIGFMNIFSDRDGQTSIGTLKTKPFHIALEGDDLELLNGYDMLKDLCEDPSVSRPAFVIISRPLNKPELMYALELGIDDIMIRPIVQADLLPKLRNAYTVFTNPKNPERLYEYAKFKFRDTEYDEAFKVYEALSQSMQKTARPLIGMARVLLAKGNVDEALKLTNTGIQRNQNYIHAYILRAEIYTALQNTEKSYEDLKTAITLSPLNITRYEAATALLLKQHRYEECIQILTIALSSGLRHPSIIERLGFCYFSKKEYPNALKFLKEANHLAPENISYANSLAICYRDSKEYDKAVLTYNQILKMQPDNHLILYNKSLTLILWDKKEEAIKLLRRVLKIDPSYAKAKEKLAELGAAAEGGQDTPK